MFAIDYDDWRSEWSAWLAAHPLKRTRSPFKGRNFLADDILGVFQVGGQAVELSEVTFPNLSDRDSRGRLIERQNRMIGITREDGTTDVVDSFTALETALNL